MACFQTVAARGDQMSIAPRLLDRLERAREVAAGRWVARCPAHEDRSPSLSIRETDDGRLLVHCFAGCETSDVLAAVGLALGDLFPDRGDHRVAPSRPNHWHATREALRVLHHEALVVLIAAEHTARGDVLSAEDRQRLSQAVVAIRTAAEATR
jgi:hypothetical protein